MRKLVRSTVFYIVLAVVALILVSQLFRGGSDREKLSLSTFERKVAAGQVRSAEVSELSVMKRSSSSLSMSICSSKSECRMTAEAPASQRELWSRSQPHG